MNNNYKDPHYAPDPEDIVLYRTYAFTLSPAIEYTDVIQFRASMTKLLNDLSMHNDVQYIAYELYPEISHHCRLHLHGYIATNDIIKLYLKFLLPLQSKATYCLKEIKDAEWDKYVNKQKLIPWKINSRISSDPQLIINKITVDNDQQTGKQLLNEQSLLTATYIKTKKHRK